MGHVLFETGGDWDSTLLLCDGEEVTAERLLVELRAGRDEDGEPCRGGVGAGGQMTATIRVPEADQPEAIFPGKLDMVFPKHRVSIVNEHPGFAFEQTKVWLDDREITAQVVEVIVDIDAVENNVRAFLVLYRTRFLAAPEVATYNLL